MAFVLDDMAIAAIIASMAGTAMQYKATSDARDRQDQATRASLARQAELQRQAEGKAMDQAKQFTTDNRVQQQGQIEQQLTQDFAAPAESAQQINAKQATTQGDVSGDYTAAKAAADVNTLKNARTFAGWLAKTTAAGRLRQNEAVNLADTAAGIDRLGNFSRGQQKADEIGINMAGRPDAGLAVGGHLLQQAGMAYLGRGGVDSAASTGATATTDIPSMSMGSGMSNVAPIPGMASGPLSEQVPSGLGTGFWEINNAPTYKVPNILKSGAYPYSY